MSEHKCPLCPRKTRKDNLSRHFGTHVVEFINSMSEERKQELIRTKNTVLTPDLPMRDGKFWVYCTVCKKLKSGEAGDAPGSWLQKHSTKDCLKQWDRVSYLFQGGLVKHVQPRQYVDSSGKEALEKKVAYLKGMLEKIRTDVEDARRPLMSTYKREEDCDFALSDIITYIDDNIDGTGEEEQEEDDKS